ncbi:MAG: IS21 family transposase [Bradymonadaceae bacterium]|nr:IS21 family transposase [Lujinxingiaceae bacterium]
MDQIHAIRHKLHVEKKSVRQVAREVGQSRNTVKKYLTQPEPVRQQKAPRPRPKREQVEQPIEQIFEQWEKETTRKQRITATAVHAELVARGFAVGQTLVRDYVRARRLKQKEVFLPLVHYPGDEAQVDFFEVDVELEGAGRSRAHMFVMRLMYSGRDFVWLYPRQDQLCFLDGHVRAFEHFGGVPQRIVYDNLKAAVQKIVRGERDLSERFERLSQHYLFEPCFARPYTGHDKGGVEARGKGIRLAHMVPIPKGSDLATLSQALLGRIEHSAETKRRRGEDKSVLELFEEERKHFIELTSPAFEARRYLSVSVSSRSMVRVEGAWYSVPARWARRRIELWVGVEKVEMACDGERVVCPRAAFGGRVVRYVDDYLSELRKKPQAVRQLMPELLGELGEPYATLWRLWVECYGPKAAARRFAALLGRVEQHGRVEIGEQIARALANDCLDAWWSELGGPAPLPVEVTVPLALQGFEIESATAASFDILLEQGGDHE